MLAHTLLATSVVHSYTVAPISACTPSAPVSACKIVFTCSILTLQFPSTRIGKDRWNDFIAKRSDELTERLCRALTSFMNDLKKSPPSGLFGKFSASVLISEPRGTLRSRQNSPSSKASGDRARGIDCQSFAHPLRTNAVKSPGLSESRRKLCFWERSPAIVCRRIQ